MSTSLLIAALCLYLISTLFYLLQISTGALRMGIPAFICLAGGFVVQLVSLVLRYFQAGYAPVTNLPEALSFFAFCVAGFFLYLRRSYKIDLVGAIVAPVLSLMLIWSLTYATAIRPLPPVLKSFWLPVHTFLAFSGNAIFLVAFFVSLLYIVVERSIKKKTSLSLSPRIPSLETLDAINYRCMSYGFPLLTVGIITGSIWAGFAWGSHWSWDPKETWSLVTWIVYAILLHNRLTIGWRGRKTAYMMIIGFFFMLFTFLGVNLFTGGLHSYGQW
ncbi:MAG TPA: c-type cytochrome biogenesis protein CcsB [Syntrophorhabdaceae bacterium]|jgi:cytochrome c-type biogenesis protein CcsB